MSLQVNVKNGEGTQTITSLTGIGKTTLNTKDKYIDDYIIVDVASNTEDATATAADILSPKTAYIADGTKATGTIQTKTSSDLTLVKNTITAPAGYYATNASKFVPVTVLDNSIISGQAYEEATGDYAWKSTVSVPEGYHNAQTIEKTFSEIFPAPSTPATANELRLGYLAYDSSGVLMTGAMTEKSEAVYTPSTSDLTIAGSLYLTGAQTIKAVTLNADANNMLSGTSVSVESNGSVISTVSGDIPTKTASDLTSSADTVTVPSGYYATEVSKAVAAGTLGTVSATKGSVSNHSISVTPSVDAGTAGYNTMAAYSGTAVSVSASELVSGSETKTANGTYDVTNLASLVVSIPVYDYSLYCPCLCFTANTAGSTISMLVTGTPTLSLNFTYSTDKLSWSTFTPGTTTITLTNAGDKVYFKGNNPNGISERRSIYYQFVIMGSVAASGNIMSLIDNGACTTLTIPNEWCFYCMFQNCTSLTTAPALPATTLANSCYYNMFNGCTSLTTAPALPATFAADWCYAGMFASCTSLTTAPALPATTLASYCYRDMFSGCTSLTTAPALPATTLAEYCYGNMFNGCTSLTTAPALPATTLANCCYYNMFYDCTSLTTAPALPATTLASYCYYCMFQNCTSLTTPPPLPATTLAEYCYGDMFYDCTSLTTPPALPATTLACNCYEDMFNGCTSLIVSDTSGTGYSTAWKIPTSGTFTDTFGQQNMFVDCATGSGRGSDHMAGASGNSYTYYTQNTPVS